MTEEQKLNDEKGSPLVMALPIGLVVIVMILIFSTIDIKQ
jgi:hypothetical protein